MSGGAVFGRETEIAVLDRLLAGEDRPDAIVLSGGAGIGKTTLWRVGVELAAAHGMRVLTTRPGSGEVRLSLSGLADLLERIDDEALDALPGPQARALRVALLREEPGDVVVDPRTIASALLALLRQLARRGPVLVAVDDAQWLDRPSLAALTFAARRLEREDVTFLVAVRSGSPVALVDAFAESRVHRMEVVGLGLAAIRDVIREHLGRAPPRWALVRLTEASQGNPLFALEVARQLSDSSGPEQPLPVPDDVRTAVRERVSALPKRTRDLLLAAALLTRADEGTIEQVVRGHLDRALEPAERAEIAGLEDDVVVFKHPLYADAVVSFATSAERRGMHRRLSAVVAQPEERARHVSLATRGRSDEVAGTLDEGAEHALARGGLQAAAELLERARELTETPSAELGRTRGIRAAELHGLAGNRDRAGELLRELLAEALTPEQRGEALRLVAGLRLGDEELGDSERLLLEALSHAHEPWRVARILLELVFIKTLQRDFEAAASFGRRALTTLEAASEDALLADALAYTAMAEYLTGAGVDWHDVERARALENPDLVGLPGLRPGAVAGLLRLYVGQHAEARAQLDATLASMLERGEERDLTHLLMWMSWLEMRRGQFDKALQLADEAVTMGELTGNQSFARLAGVQRGLTLAHTGDLAEARRICAEALAHLNESGVAQVALWIETTLTHAAISEGDAGAAWRHCEPLMQVVEGLERYEPTVFMFVPDGVEALVALGWLDRAEAVLDTFEQIGRRLDRTWALATGRRCRALLLAARGDIEGALAASEEALTVHDRLDMPLERARTLLVQGGVLRRARRRAQARRSLTHAATEFERIGARVWSERARRELDQIGGRPAASGELTPAEHRVAELAAEGRSNKEIAAALFVSVHTVEVHLSRAYAKLGVRSRAQLARRLERPDRG